MDTTTSNSLQYTQKVEQNVQKFCNTYNSTTPPMLFNNNPATNPVPYWTLAEPVKCELGAPGYYAAYGAPTVTQPAQMADFSAGAAHSVSNGRRAGAYLSYSTPPTTTTTNCNQSVPGYSSLHRQQAFLYCNAGGTETCTVGCDNGGAAGQPPQFFVGWPGYRNPNTTMYNMMVHQQHLQYPGDCSR